MTKIAKRYLIGGAVGAVALLTALGIFAFKTAEKLTPASTEAKPAPVAAALTLPSPPEKTEAEPKPEAPASPPAADLANAFGAALGVGVKDSPKKSGAPSSPSQPSNPGQASSPSPSRASSSDTLDLGSKKEREARFGSHNTEQAGVRQIGGQEKTNRSSGADDKITFETNFK